MPSQIKDIELNIEPIYRKSGIVIAPHSDISVLEDLIGLIQSHFIESNEVYGMMEVGDYREIVFELQEKLCKLEFNRKIAGTIKEAIQEQINEEDFYFYWIMKSGDAIEIYSIVDYLKKKYPNSKHVAGGTHVDMLPEETSKIFDSIVVGPGEESFVNAINDNCSNKKYFQDYKKHPFLETPYPDRSLLPKDTLVNKNMFKQYVELNETILNMFLKHIKIHKTI